ncbi:MULTISPECIES: type II toxin-antitoxin system RelE/ParE family toxin [unclassified Microbacterium]|uniref:type II toxin-antitoxin system RelE family toxin n=1 Tax=unclassified Microbacterium TaxID=2609290 RepID=UPI001FCF1120|nr:MULTISPECIES: type II toxin-antitoxin system RelE/ParE family toxin [unclassified Microbacterium]
MGRHPARVLPGPGCRTRGAGAALGRSRGGAVLFGAAPLSASRALEKEPRPNGVRKLTGFDNAWRVRIGDHRVLYEVVDDVVLVTVFRVAHRRDVYGDL